MQVTEFETLYVNDLGQYGDSPALDLPGVGTVTYKALSEDVDAYAIRFGSTRRLILLEFSTSYKTIVAYLAALKTHNPIILADPNKEAANKRTAKEFGVELYISSDGSVEERSVERSYELHPNLAIMLSTSGSTGKPRLVRLSRKNIQSISESTSTFLKLRSSDVAALALPLHGALGLSELNSYLFSGAKCIGTDLAINSVEYLNWLRDSGCTCFTGVPYAFEVFEQLGFRKREFPDFRCMTVGGGKLSPKLVTQYATHLQERGASLFIDYGQTEAGRMAYLPPEDVLTDMDSIGRPAPGLDLYLVDEDGARITQANTPGELVCVGPNVMMGYALTGEDLSEGYTLEERHTGDIAERKPSGYFKIIGRQARFSKISGFRVSHQSIEEHLAENHIGALVSGTDEYLIVALTDKTSPEEATKAVLQTTSLNAMQLRVFHLEEVPRLSNGKPDYQTIKATAEKLPGKRDLEEHANPITKAFAEAFWPQAVKPTDSFRSLGGDSLTYVQLSVALEKEMGAVPPNWETMPVSALLQKRGSGSRWVKIDPNSYLRALAIILIVVDHVSFVGLRGGAPVLMMLVGYSMARFQTKPLFSGHVGVVGRSLAKNLMLFYLALTFWFIYRQGFSLNDVLLVSNIFVPHIETWRIAYNAYWFVEAYAQILLLVIVVFSIPWLRSRVSNHPLGIGIGAFVLSLGSMFAWRETWRMSWNSCSVGDCFPVTESAFLVAMGWCFYFAQSTVSKMLVAAGSILTLILLPAFHVWGGRERVDLMGLCIILILWQVRLPAPAWISRVIATVAAYSYAIYLFHLIPYTVLAEHGHAMVGFVPVTLGFAAGFAGQWGFDGMWRQFLRIQKQGMQGEQGSYDQGPPEEYAERGV